jgi:hypothetical protein
MPRRFRRLRNRVHYLQPVWLLAVSRQVSCGGVDVLPYPFLIEEADRHHVEFVRSIQASFLSGFEVDTAARFL